MTIRCDRLNFHAMHYVSVVFQNLLTEFPCRGQVQIASIEQM